MDPENGSANMRPVVGPTPMLGDNAATNTLIQQEGASARTRYFERATLLVKRAVLLLMLSPYLIKTDMMAADIFTKATPRDTFIKMRNFLMNVNWTIRGQLENAMCGMSGNSRRLAQIISSRV